MDGYQNEPWTTILGSYTPPPPTPKEQLSFYNLVNFQCEISLAEWILPLKNRFDSH